MILDVLLGGLLGVVQALVALIPEWSPELDGLSTAASTLGQWARMGDNYFPVGTLLSVLAVLLAFRLVLIVWRVATRVWELLPLT